MMADQFDGDIAYFVTQDGGDILYSGGQPQMDTGGLETSVLISLFTGVGWWGNGLELSAPDNQIGSIFESTVQPKAITIKALKLIEQEAENALRWMISQRVAKEITVEASSPELNKVEISIFITKHNGDSVELKYNTNWESGFLRPVTARSANARS